MRIHMVAIDVDGTLVTSAKEVTNATAAILRMARKQAGVHVVLATGRPPRSVMDIYRRLDLDTPMINYNGALVYDPAENRILMHRPLGCEIARQIASLARREYPEVVVSGEILDRWYTDRFDPKWLTETAKLFRPDVVAPIDEWLTEPVTKVLLLGEPERMQQLAEKIRVEFLHQVTIVRTVGYLLQITHATVSKRHALQVVANEMGVTREQIMAIGDHVNDISMLRWAGVGVAMANAVPPVLAAADYVTDHHNADGAAKAIHDIILGGLEGMAP